MDNLELINTLINNSNLVNILNNFFESMLYSIVITLIISLFKLTTNKLKRLILPILVAILIMLISLFAIYTMGTYGVTLLQLELGQFLILKQLNITTNDTIIFEIISNGTISSIHNYYSISIHIIHEYVWNIVVIIIIGGSILYETYKRLKNFNKLTKP
jgi:glycerol uptake facilitator-like aquaporin